MHLTVACEPCEQYHGKTRWEKLWLTNTKNETS